MSCEFCFEEKKDEYCNCELSGWHCVAFVDPHYRSHHNKYLKKCMDIINNKLYEDIKYIMKYD